MILVWKGSTPSRVCGTCSSMEPSPGGDPPPLVAVAVHRLVFLASLVRRAPDELRSLDLHGRLQHGLRRQPAIARKALLRSGYRSQQVLAEPLRRRYLSPHGDDSFLPAGSGLTIVSLESSPYFVYISFGAPPADRQVAKGASDVGVLLTEHLSREFQGLAPGSLCGYAVAFAA